MEEGFLRIQYKSLVLKKSKTFLGNNLKIWGLEGFSLIWNVLFCKTFKAESSVNLIKFEVNPPNAFLNSYSKLYSERPVRFFWISRKWRLTWRPNWDYPYPIHPEKSLKISSNALIKRFRYGRKYKTLVKLLENQSSQRNLKIVVNWTLRRPISGIYAQLFVIFLFSGYFRIKIVWK